MGCGKTCFNVYFQAVSRHSRAWLAFWFLVIPLGVFVGFRLLKETHFTFSAPEGTPGYEAKQHFEKSFPSQQGVSQIILYLSCANCTNIVEDNYASSSMETLKKLTWEWERNNTAKKGGHALVKHVNDFWNYYNKSCSFTLNLTDIITCSTKKGSLIPCERPFTQSDCYSQVAGVYLSDNVSDSTAMIMSVEYEVGHASEGADLISTLRGKIADLQQTGYYLGLTAQAALVVDMTTASHHDIAVKDPIVLPIALIVLAFVVQSWRLMFIPVFCVSCSVCLSYSIMYPVAAYLLTCSPFMPTIMISVTIAMSIDYSLFLLTRYREEIEKELQPLEAVRNMTRYAGHVVVVSGCILSITYAGLVLFPMDMLISIGVGAATAILCTIFVNLTLTPALLLAFPNFFKQKTTCNCCKKERGNGDGLLYEDGIQVNQRRMNSEAEEREANTKMQKSLWFRWGMFTTRFPWNVAVILLTYAMIAPVGWQLSKFEYQIDGRLVFPSSSLAIETSNKMKEHFAPGEISPFFIIAETVGATVDNWETGTGIYNNDYLTATCNTMKEMVRRGYANATDLRSVNYHPGMTLDWGHINKTTGTSFHIGPMDLGCIENGTMVGWYDWKGQPSLNKTFSEPYSAGKLLRLLSQYPPFQLLWNQTVGDRATLITFQVPLDPFGHEIQNYTHHFRDFLDSQSNGYVKYYLTGSTIDELDSVDQIYSIFPIMLGIIVAVIFVLMGITFKSVFVPLRLFLTITVPLLFVYGMAIIIYQFGHLKTGPFAGTGGLYWITPVMSVTILVGLALDYDVFLFARIHEFRQQENFTTRGAIVRGVHATGSVITAAGVIMAVAFSGLLMSDIRSLNQFGFILCFAVLVDTFIIRTALVPAVLSLAREVNWWPTNMPTSALKDSSGRISGTSHDESVDSYYTPGLYEERDDESQLASDYTGHDGSSVYAPIGNKQDSYSPYERY